MIFMAKKTAISKSKGKGSVGASQKQTNHVLKNAFLSVSQGIKTNIEVHEGVSGLVNPILIEGLPGIGFVGKLAAEHLVSELKAKKIATIINFFIK